MEFWPKAACALAFIVGGLFAPLQTYAQESGATTEQSSYWLCQLNQVVRSIRVDRQQNGNCVTVYTKEGLDEVVGRSSTVKTCEDVADNIYKNLLKASWQCKDIRARVSSFHE